MDHQLEHEPSWLCPNGGDRERLLDMDRRLQRTRVVAMGLLGLALIGSAPFLGWWPVGVLLATGLTWAVVERRMDRVSKPEWLIAAGTLLSLGAIAVSVLLTGGANSPAKSWLLIPAITLPARFSKRGVNAGVAITLLLLAAVMIAAEPGEVRHHPQLFLFPAALIGAAIALTMALRSAEIQHRREAVIDPLTGMLNRKALEVRTTELEQQSRITGQPVGLVLCDIDHFKAVNDTFGHSTGDAVLQNVAYRIRKELRAYDLAYRLGGEEFLVVVPGAMAARTGELGERLRAAVASESYEGVEVTISIGVAASGTGGLDFPAVFEQADEALYRAKAGGRNRVAGPDDPAFAVLG